MASFDRFTSVNIMIQNDTPFGFLKAIMMKDGVYDLWDTSDLSNTGKFQGIVIFNEGKFQVLATRGSFKTDMADGTYYADSTGTLVNALPNTSFSHEIGKVSGGVFTFTNVTFNSLEGLIEFMGFTNCGC